MILGYRPIISSPQSVPAEMSGLSTHGLQAQTRKAAWFSGDCTITKSLLTLLPSALSDPRPAEDALGLGRNSWHMQLPNPKTRFQPVPQVLEILSGWTLPKWSCGQKGSHERLRSGCL